MPHHREVLKTRKDRAYFFFAKKSVSGAMRRREMENGKTFKNNKEKKNSLIVSHRKFWDVKSF